LFCGSGWLPMIDHIAARLHEGSTIACWDRTTPLVEAVREIDVLLPSNAHITADVIAAASRLRLIQQPAAGTEGIDRAAAIARGIPICNAPGTNQIAVAECALYLLLALARHAPVAAKTFAAREVGVPLGIELSGRTLGIIGMGRSGKALADRARALGMTVQALERGATADQRREFFAACNAISIHCPLNDSTRGLVGAEAFAAMRPGAFVINVARGGVIDRDALVAALASGKLGGVGLDVHWIEPPDPNDPLYADPRVVALPHVAGSTQESFMRITEVVIENLSRLSRGDQLLNRVA
jgi:phosphoglycerate dehydrogenase-like enzyme